MNMDETTVYFAYANLKGTVFGPAIAKQYSIAATHENIAASVLNSIWCLYVSLWITAKTAASVLNSIWCLYDSL